VRVVQKVEESKVSMEERLEVVEGRLESIQDELSKMRQLLLKLFERDAEGSPGNKGGAMGVMTAEQSLGGALLAEGEGNGGLDKERD